jgi:hypothetical protein
MILRQISICAFAVIAALFCGSTLVIAQNVPSSGNIPLPGAASNLAKPGTPQIQIPTSPLQAIADSYRKRDYTSIGPSQVGSISGSTVTFQGPPNSPEGMKLNLEGKTITVKSLDGQQASMRDITPGKFIMVFRKADDAVILITNAPKQQESPHAK